MQKLEKKTMLALMRYVLKIKYHIVFNILLLSNIKNSHYVLIKDFNRLMNNETKYHGKKTLFSILHTMFL